MTPHAPLMPWTEMAPQGSSTLATWSKNQTPKQTRNPATRPMMAAAQGATKAQGAVIATSPASIPLHDMEISGLPYLALVYAIAVTNPKQAAIKVLTATVEIRRSVAPSVEPGLNPIQPNSRIMVPMTT